MCLGKEQTPKSDLQAEAGPKPKGNIRGCDSQEKKEESPLQLPETAGTLWATVDFPGGSDGKAPAYNTGDLGPIPESGRSPGEGNGNPLQYSCLENPMDGEAW